MESSFSPTEGSLDRKVDSVLGRLDSAQPQATNKSYTQHTVYKVVEPTNPRRKDFEPVVVGVDLHVAQVELVDMHIKVVSPQVDLVATKDHLENFDFATIKVDLTITKVGLARKKVGSSDERNEFATAKVPAIFAKVSLAIVVVFLAVAMLIFAAKNISLDATRVSPAAAKDILITARVVRQILGLYPKGIHSSQIGSRHIHQEQQNDQVEHMVHLMECIEDYPWLVNHIKHKPVGMGPKPCKAIDIGYYLTQTNHLGQEQCRRKIDSFQPCEFVINSHWFHLT